MKLTSFRHQNKNSYGIVVDNGVIDLTNRIGNKYKDLLHFIEGNGLQDREIQNLIAKSSVDYQLSDIKFLPVIPKPDKIICVGANYDEHRMEANLEKTQNPTIFLRLAQSQIGHEEGIFIPKESSMLDYEGEIAVIIGRSGRRIAEEKAFEHIAGYACYNDASVRDWQLHTTQWSPGKNFDFTGAFGPWMVTRDEIADNQPLTIQTRLNGQVVQQATTEHLIFSIPSLISYISTFTTLLPGDVIVTGTPSGVGLKQNPPLFMKHGDVVEVEVSRIGTLRNTIKAE